MLRKILAAAVICVVWIAAPNAHAQQALVVDSCGSLPQTLQLGNQHVIYQDKNGNQCVAGTGGGGGGGAVTVADGEDVTQGAKADAVCSTATGTCSIEALIKFLNSQVIGPTPAGTNLIGNVGTGLYPAGSTAVSASATGTTAATTATLAGASGKTTYVCSYSVRANATAATTVQNTLTGILGGTDTHQFWVAPAASGIGVDEQIFTPCHPASAPNTAISAVSGAPGTGGLVSVTIKGFQL